VLTPPARPVNTAWAPRIRGARACTAEVTSGKRADPGRHRPTGLLDPRRADRLLLGGLPRRLVLRLLRLLLAATLMLLPRVVLVLSGLELLRLGLGGTGPGGGERLLGAPHAPGPVGAVAP